jgi:pre-mRNA-splicing factor ATP-dependent RNA helicase DHX15/PRP43
VEWAKQKCSVSIKSSKLANEQISVFALYGKQSPEEQQKVFICKPNERKIIFATNIAETSVTIDGIVFIVDSGFTKNLVFDSTRNITSLKVIKYYHSCIECAIE